MLPSDGDTRARATFSVRAPCGVQPCTLARLYTHAVSRVRSAHWHSGHWPLATPRLPNRRDAS